MNQLKRSLRLPAVFGIALIAMAIAAPVSQAREPAPGYSQFAGCPSPEEDSAVVQCVVSTITGGHFQMGSKNVPIENPMTLSGGLHFDGTIVANSKGGLSATKQKVPGGVIGLTGLTWLLELLGSEALTLYAVTELVGQPKLAGGKLTLPIRVHLINGTLGNACYVGSPAEPITLNLITGTTSPPPPNEPITGVAPKSSYNAETKIISQTGGTYVDNSFAAPGASGCVLKLFGFIPISINGLVNSQSGLPAAAGTNETVQEFKSEAALKSVVYP